MSNLVVFCRIRTYDTFYQENFVESAITTTIKTNNSR